MDNSGIYGLFDPRNGCLQYVGFAFNFKKRLQAHCIPSNLRGSNKKNNWIKCLLDQGLKPILKVIEEITLTGERAVDRKILGKAEIFWIASFRVAGAELKNGNDGGEGGGSPYGHMSEDTKAKLSASMKGKPLSEDHKASLRESAKARCGKPANNRGIPHSEQTKQKISKARRNRIDPQTGRATSGRGDI